MKNNYKKRLSFISHSYLIDILIDKFNIPKNSSKDELIELMIVNIKDIDNFININFPLPVGPKDDNF
jgi:hypothetical protein